MKFPFKMTFGKYRGELLENLPLDYIEWVLENVDFADRNELHIEIELQKQAALKRGEGVVRGKNSI